jgi:hypothetical protein
MQLYSFWIFVSFRLSTRAGKLDYHQGIKSQQQVVDMFTKTKPFGTTCLEGALAAGFKVCEGEVDGKRLG